MPHGHSPMARAPGKARSTGLVAMWLLVLAILTHALLPIAAPWARTNGSAFSASTVEVTTGPSRARQQLKPLLVRRADPPPGAGAAPAAVLYRVAELSAPSLASRPAHNPARIEVLPREHRGTSAQPRAPPLT